MGYVLSLWLAICCLFMSFIEGPTIVAFIGGFAIWGMSLFVSAVLGVLLWGFCDLAESVRKDFLELKRKYRVRNIRSS